MAIGIEHFRNIAATGFTPVERTCFDSHRGDAATLAEDKS